MITGSVRADERAPGGFEVEAQEVEVVAATTEEYPISLKEHGPDFLLSNRHLWLRSRKQVALMRLRDQVIRSIRNFFHERDFLNIDAPIFTPAACEGTTTLFEVDYFDDEKAYLTQSGQLYMEAAAMAFGKAYCFGPTFRAEKSKTRRHLTEFWMVEPEAAFYDLADLADLAAVIDELDIPAVFAEAQASDRDAEALADALSGVAVVTLDTEVTPELEAEGLARDVVREIQNARKAEDLVVTDRIDVWVDVASDTVTAAINAHQSYIAEQVLATSITMGAGDDDLTVHDAKVGGETLRFFLRVR